MLNILILGLFLLQHHTCDCSSKAGIEQADDPTNGSVEISGSGVEDESSQSSKPPLDEEKINDGVSGDIIDTMDLLEGDIILTPQQKSILKEYKKNQNKNADTVHKRAVVTRLYQKWDNAIVPYQYSSNVPSSYRSVINQAMRGIEAQTCVRFVPRRTQRDYISIIRGDGCYSYIGRISGSQPVSIGQSCNHQGIVQHELLHALGRWHEHSRPDRDQYIMIHSENIKDGRADQFDKLAYYEANTNSIQYDYSSIMHYSAYSFSRNRRATITPKNSNVPLSSLGQRERLSEHDIQHVMELYCDTNAPTWSQWSSWSQCSASCGPGDQIRTRTCSSGACTGPGMEVRQCQLTQCYGTWRSWSQWSTCSATCGRGRQSRTRTCGSTRCLGSSTEARYCQMAQCFATWNNWSQWSPCTVSCGRGRQTRTRTCSSRYGFCLGSGTDTRLCQQAECAPTWNNWGKWTTCSASCGLGFQSRSRTCISGNCVGSSTQARQCQVTQCFGKWGNWGQWSSCSPSCGLNRIRKRTRSCLGGKPCLGLDTQNQRCESKSCTQDRGMTQWSSWSNTCRNCNYGSQYRYRQCISVQLGCTFPFYQIRPCICNQELSQDERNVNLEATTNSLTGAWNGSNTTMTESSTRPAKNTISPNYIGGSSGSTVLQLSGATTIFLALGNGLMSMLL